MAGTRTRNFSDAEDQVIIEAIAKYPYNFRAAFEYAATLINRSVGTCTLRWYKYIKFRNPTVLLGTNEVLIRNTKNIPRYDGATIDVAIAVQTLLERTDVIRELNEDTKAKLRELLL